VSGKREITTLEELLDRIENAGEGEERVALGEIIRAVGRRSFGPLLLLAGLITLAPVVGDIPGMPTMMGLFVLLTAGQLLFRRDHFWMPRWMLERTVPQSKLRTATGWMRRPARFVDRWSRQRHEQLVEGPWVSIIAAACIAIAAAMPAMELVPFSANAAGLALTAFGLALIARDGLVAAGALVVSAATLGTIIFILV
jgi:hypothetical protein